MRILQEMLDLKLYILRARSPKLIKAIDLYNSKYFLLFLSKPPDQPQATNTLPLQQLSVNLRK